MKFLIKVALVAVVGFMTYKTVRDSLQSNSEKGVNEKALPLPKTVKAILKNPEEFLNKEVNVEGYVSASVNIMGLRGYKISDGKGNVNELIVIPLQKAVPREGTMVNISGRIEQFVKIGGFEVTILRES